MEQIKIRSMYLFIYKFNQIETLPIRTLIFPQKNIIFNRIFEQNKYSKETVEKQKSIIIGDVTFDINNNPFEKKYTWRD